MTIYLREENANISKNKSSNVKITKKAMEILKKNLKEHIELYQLNFNKECELTTDTINYAIGAV